MLLSSPILNYYKKSSYRLISEGRRIRQLNLLTLYFSEVFLFCSPILRMIVKHFTDYMYFSNEKLEIRICLRSTVYDIHSFSPVLSY